MRRKLGSPLRWVLIVVAVVLLVSFARNFLRGPAETGPTEAPYNEFLTSLDNGEVTKVDIHKAGDFLEVVYVASGASYKTKALVEEYQPLREDLTKKYNINPNVKMDEPSTLEKAFGFFIQFLPMIFIAGILFFFLRSVSSNQSHAVKFGQSRGRLFDGSRPAVTFSDVAGVEEAKEELEEVVEFLKNPKKFSALGARIPKGVLLIGPPGCGKTLLAKAVAGEAGVAFFSISGSEFVEMFVGVGASRVRDLFDRARKNAPCIIFIDEIDAVGRLRGAGLGGGHDEREQTLNQILVEMDGFEPWANIILIAATNRPDILDPALLRPGRFDRQVVLDHPDVKARQAILEVHLKGKPVSPPTIDISSVAKQTPGFTGADLANVANEAAILAARRGKPKITMEELTEAVDRVIAGPERKSRVISTREKEIIAYHEGGHALVAHLTPGADIPFKISIVARGMAGGFTRFVQQEENRLRPRSEYKAMLITLMGGHAAERLLLGKEDDPERELEVTAGPHNDIEKATYIARQMVMKWGMSKRIGPRSIGRSREGTFLGRDMFEVRDYSEATATMVDEEVEQLLRDSEQKAFEVLSQNRAKLERLVAVLVKEETIDGEKLQIVLGSLEEPLVKKN